MKNTQQFRYEIQGQVEGKNIWGGKSLFWFTEKMKTKEEYDIMAGIIMEDKTIASAYGIDLTNLAKNLPIK